MVSERKKLANQRNAQKSTGPRTEAGKARSRCNALKHGLAGSGTVLPPEDRALFQERMLGFSADVRPQGMVETYLVACVALASVRIDRCARTEFTVIARKRQAAITRWEHRRDERLERLAENLNTDPAATVAELTEFTEGIEWLLDRWDDLGEALAEVGHWTDAQLDQAIRLLGKSPEPDPDSDPDSDSDAAGAAEPDPQVDAFRAAAAASRPGPGEPDDQAIATARARLIGLAQAEVNRLEAARHQLWHNDDGPALADQINVATFDGTRKGTLRHRYQTAASSAFHRALDQLARERRQAATKTSRPPFDPARMPRIEIAGHVFGGSVDDPPPAEAPAASEPEPQPQPQPPAPPAAPEPVAPPAPAPAPAEAPEPEPAPVPVPLAAPPAPSGPARVEPTEAASAGPDPEQPGTVTAAADSTSIPNPKPEETGTPAAPAAPPEAPAAAQPAPRPPQTAAEWWAEARRLGKAV